MKTGSLVISEEETGGLRCSASVSSRNGNWEAMGWGQREERVLSSGAPPTMERKDGKEKENHEQQAGGEGGAGEAWA